MLRRLCLKGTMNTRELGGFPVGKFNHTGYKAFLRSDDLSKITREDIEYLKEYGLTTVIDLRNTDEIELSESLFCNMEGINYFNVTLTENYDFVSEQSFFSLDMPQMYLEVAKNHKGLARLFNTMAENSQGITLFHCVAGKDRTGVVTCILLMLAGVSLLDIMADHQVSNTYLIPAMDSIRARYPDMPMHVNLSDPLWIKGVYDYIVDNFGTARSYLEHMNVPGKNIDILYKKITGAENF